MYIGRGNQQYCGNPTSKIDKYTHLSSLIRKKLYINLIEQYRRLELVYLYFPPSSHLVYLCFCPVGLSLL